MSYLNETTICPRCGTANNTPAPACSCCELPLTADNSTHKFDQEVVDEVLYPTDRTFICSDKQPIILKFESGGRRSILIKDEITIGRNSHDLADTGFIVNLAPFGAYNLGVSRIHAQIKRKNLMLFLIDMHSSNGTWLAGYKLRPGAAQVIRDGDGIYFGKVNDHHQRWWLGIMHLEGALLVAWGGNPSVGRDRLQG